MDINTFESFLESQRGGFETFLKGCKDLNRVHMRLALSTHSSKMTFALATELPILAVGSRSSPFGSGTRSGRRSVTSPFKSPVFYGDQSSPTPQSFKSTGTISEAVSPFTRNASSAVTTPKSNKVDPRSASKGSPCGGNRTSSGGVRSILRGGTIGGAGLLFKPATPTSKKYALDAFHLRSDDSSAGSPPPSDDSYTNKRSSHKRSASTKATRSAKSSHTPNSPFELVARDAERKKPYPDSESTSDFEIPVRRSTLRKVSSTRSQKDRATPKKGAGGMMDVDDAGDVFSGDIYSDEPETPSKKQKTAGGAGAARKSPVKIDLTL